MPKLLVIDDEPSVLYSLESALTTDTLAVLTASTAKKGIQVAQDGQPDVVLLDVKLPDMSGLDVFHELQKIDSHLPVIIMTAFASTDTAIEAMKRGAFDYLTKPVDLRQLRAVVAQAIDLRETARIPAEFQNVDQLETAAETIVGHSLPMQQVYKSIGRVAATDVNVLILGESGTGKELVARAIHHHSHRSRKPMLAINCAAIPETLLESELFGHERGSFTGADKSRVGKFEQADGGTIFLDEIGDMTGPTQAKVLRVLQDQRFDRVGGNKLIETDVRLIAATNQKLEELATSGRFRRDLYYRLKVYTIELPALRERIDDVPLLVNHFIKLYSRDIGRRVRSASAETIQLLQQYLWPGNVRELQGVIKNALVNAIDEVLTPDCLPDSVRRGIQLTEQLLAPPDGKIDAAELARTLLLDGENEIYRKVLLAVDRAVLEEVMSVVQNNQVEAARRLGISRTTLRAKLRAVQIATEATSPNSEQPGQ